MDSNAFQCQNRIVRDRQNVDSKSECWVLVIRYIRESPESEICNLRGRYMNSKAAHNVSSLVNKYHNDQLHRFSILYIVWADRFHSSNPSLWRQFAPDVVQSNSSTDCCQIKCKNLLQYIKLKHRSPVCVVLVGNNCYSSTNFTICVFLGVFLV